MTENGTCTRCYSLEHDGTWGAFSILVVPFIFRAIALSGFWWLHPLGVLIMSQLADFSDMGVHQWCVPIPSVGPNNHELVRLLYNRHDKIGDALLYVAAFAYLMRWRRELWYAKWTMWFVAYRLVGNFVFLISGGEKRIILVVFANFGETVFVIYAVLDFFRVDRRIERNVWANVAIIVVAAAFKLGVELSMHVAEPNKALFGSGACFSSLVRVYEYGYKPVAVAFLIVYLFGGLVRPHFVDGTVTRNGAGAFVPVSVSLESSSLEHSVNRRVSDKNKQTSRTLASGPWQSGGRVKEIEDNASFLPVRPPLVSGALESSSLEHSVNRRVSDKNKQSSRTSTFGLCQSGDGVKEVADNAPVRPLVGLCVEKTQQAVIALSQTSDFQTDVYLNKRARSRSRLVDDSNLLTGENTKYEL